MGGVSRDRPQRAERSPRAGSTGRTCARLTGWVAAALALAVLAAACGGPAKASTTRGAPVVTVVTGLWPLEQAAIEVGQGNVRVVDVVPRGEDPRTYRLDASEAHQVRTAGLVIEMPGNFQPSLSAAAAGARHVLELAPPPGGAGDPWLSPQDMQTVARDIQAALAGIDPAARETFANGEDDEAALLSSLDGDFISTLDACSERTVVTSGDAFSVLDKRYQLHVVPLDGARSQPLRPSQALVAREVALIRRSGVRVIYRDVWEHPDGLLQVQAEAGVRLGTLDPLTGEPASGWPKHLTTYFQLMEYDLQVITNGLGCAQAGIS
jgi:zinc transport system substrate-binding protein